jgi:hypothetical protein
MSTLTKLTVLDLARLFALKTHLQGLISKAEISQEDIHLGSSPGYKMVDSYQRLEDLSLVSLRCDRYHITQKGIDMIDALLSHSHILLLPGRP